jgi:MacB-like periplasmic core domain
MGRTFLEGENGAARPEDAHTILLSDAIWRDAYGADPNILGRTVKVSGEAYTVIGVMPANLRLSLGAGAPVGVGANRSESGEQVRTKHVTPTYLAIARLAPGASVVAAAREMNEIQRGMAGENTDQDYRDRIRFIRVAWYEDMLVNDSVRKSLLALSGASAVLWLIACVNVTSLLLARATARQREIAVRGALAQAEDALCSNC